MAGTGASAGLGLCSAAFWGGSDFVGGWGSRRAPALLIVAAGQVLSLAVLAALSIALGVHAPAHRFYVLAIVGGFEGALSLALFYRALSLGSMGLTAALTGLLTALIPVVFSFLREGLPAPVNLAGLVAGCAAIWMITHQPADRGDGSRKALVLGAIAGAGFGTQLILLKLASGGGVLWSLTWMRAGGVAALALALMVLRARAPIGAFLPAGSLTGILDTMGNLFYVLAAGAGRLDVAALVSSLYPAGTILLAAVVLRERPTRRQMAGIGMALAAVAMLSL